MKHSVARILISLVAACAVALPAIASPVIVDNGSSSIYPRPYPTPGPQSYGQSHTYSVLLRGNGEAVVWATVAVVNGSEKPISEIILTAKGLNPGSVEAWQEIGSRWCVFSDTNAQYSMVDSDAPCPLAIGGRKLYPSGEGRYTYRRLTVEQRGAALRFSLARPVQREKSGTVLLYYRGFGAVKSGLFGKMKFDVQTLAADDIIRSASVSAGVDTDLYFRGKRSDVEYTQRFSAPAAALESATSDVGLSAPISGQLGSGSGLYKSARELSPGDTLHVKGVYAKSWFGLNWQRIVVAILILFCLTVGAALASRAVRRRQASANSGNEPAAGRAAILGALNAALTFAVIYLVPALIDWLSRAGLGYRIEFLMPLLLLLIIILVAASVLGPSIYFGQRYGQRYGFTVFGTQIAALVVFTIISLVVLSAGAPGRDYPMPMY